MLACPVLEPWTPEALPPSPFRALAVRHGFDLEPALPDPAPAYVDPDGAYHPALMEPLASLPLHRFPTPGARSALVARLLSEPGRPDPTDPEDPTLALYRFCARQDMEPEVTGSLALLLLRAHLDRHRRTWRPALPDPVAALRDPSIDAFAHRRARLVDLDWEAMWFEIDAAAQFVGDREELGFERVIVQTSAAWLADYRAWWQVAAHLGPDERIPADSGPLREALAGFDSDLGGAIASGCAAEAEFLELVGVTPQQPVDARWLLGEQVRALRDLRTATRERSLTLHRLLRRCDLARVRAQLAYRAALLNLWLSEEPEEEEQRLLDLPDPPHPTSLGAGLGRIIGMVLLRRLRRGEHRDAAALAERALRLAPEELAVRLTWNDLRFTRGDLDAALLTSVRAEIDRWDSVSARLLGVRTAEALGDRSTGRHLGDRLAERALALGTASGWAVAVVETLRDPSARANGDRLQALVDGEPPSPGSADPLAGIVFRGASLAEGWADLQLALLQAVEDRESADGLESAAVSRPSARKGPPAWRKLVDKKLPSDRDDFAGRLSGRLLSLRAAAPSLRQPPLAAELRGLQEQLAEAAELGVTPPPELAELLPRLGAYLRDTEEAHREAVAHWLAGVRHTLGVDLTGPRRAALTSLLAARTADLRIRGDGPALGEADRLRARLADPSEDLDALDSAIARLGRVAAQPTKTSPEPGAMTLHAEFEAFSLDQLGMRPRALARARNLVRLFNLAGGRRDKKRLRSGGELYELRHRTARDGGLRVFYRRRADGWEALAAMSKFDDRQQQDAIDAVARHFSDR